MIMKQRQNSTQPAPAGWLQNLQPLMDKRRLAGSACMFGGVLLLSIAVTPRLEASREVLSDMDCVIEPSAVVDLGSAVPGLLAQTLYDRSDFVSAGTLRARLESGVEQAGLAIAEKLAGVDTAIELRQLTADFGERTRRRNASLLKTSAISRQSMDQVDTETRIARMQVRQEQENQRLAELELAQARAILNRREIISPIDGSIVQRYKSTGEYVDSEPVYQIAQLDPLHVEVIMPIEYLGQIETGMQSGVVIEVPGFEGKVLSAVVRRIDAVADAASATYGVRLILENPDMTIPSGVRCQVDFFAS